MAVRRTEGFVLALVEMAKAIIDDEGEFAFLAIEFKKVRKLPDDQVCLFTIPISVVNISNDRSILNTCNELVVNGLESEIDTAIPLTFLLGRLDLRTSFTELVQGDPKRHLVNWSVVCVGSS